MSRPTAFGLLWVAALLVPLLALAGGAWWSWQDVRKEAQASVTRIVGTLHEHARRAFETQDALLAALQWHSRHMSWPEIAASTELAELLRHLARNTPGTGNIGMVAPDGIIAQIGSVPFPPPRTDFSDRDYVRHQRGSNPGPYVSAPLFGRLTGRPAFNYSRPRLGPDGRPDGGLLWATFRPHHFSIVYAGVVEGPKDEILLFRLQDGAILASHPPVETTQIRHLPPDGAGRVAAGRALAALPQGAAGQADGVSPLDGAGRLYVARVLEGSGVGIAYGLHPEGPRRTWLVQLAGMAVVAAAAMALLLLATAVAQARARGEAQALRREAEALRQGRAEAEARAVAEAARAEAEAALRKGQRLEALGQIATGVAHDFRNTLQAAQAGATLARKALDAGDAAKARKLLAMMSEAVDRSAMLTQRMLRVAREKGPPLADEAARRAATALLDPAATVASAVELLTRTLPPGYPVLLWTNAEELPTRVLGEAGELEAAMLNMAINARDAMPQGGTISIALAGETVPPAAAAAPPHPLAGPGSGGDPPGRFLAALRPGQRYARISVTDQGVGMDALTLAKVAEPFFTTKPPDQGTGLGLASVRAFVLGVGGAMRVASGGPGQGSSVTLWLPQAMEGTRLG